MEAIGRKVSDGMMEAFGRKVSDGMKDMTKSLSNGSARVRNALICRRRQRWADIADTDDERTPNGQLKYGFKGVPERSEDPATTAPEPPASGVANGGGSDLRQRRSVAERSRPTARQGEGEPQSPGGELPAQSPAQTPPSSSSPLRRCERRSSADAAAPRGGLRCRRRRCTPEAAKNKLQCQFVIGIPVDNEFQVKGRIIGRSGKHMKDIVDAADGTKLRLRGKGSGFLEGPWKKESSDPLMLCVSSPNQEAYDTAKAGVTQLLETIYADYREFRGQPDLEMPINLHEGPREGAC